MNEPTPAPSAPTGPVTWWAMVGFFVILVGGTLGYVEIEGWSVADSAWMVLITLTTIGYGEPQPLSQLGRVYTMMLIVAGLSLGTHVVTHFTRYVVSGGLRLSLARRKQTRQRQRMKDHHVIVGYGRLGREIAQELLHSGAAVLVIDTDEKALEDLAPGCVGLCGDAGRSAVLTQARVDDAAGIAIATGDTATNVYVTLAVRQRQETVPILTRCDDDEGVQRALTAGATSVVQPYALGGVRMAQALLHPTSHRIMEQAMARETTDFAIHDLKLGQGTAMQGTLADLDLGALYDVIVIAVQHADGTKHSTPRGHTEVGPGDTLVVVGDPRDIERLEQAVIRPGAGA